MQSIRKIGTSLFGGVKQSSATNTSGSRKTSVSISNENIMISSATAPVIAATASNSIILAEKQITATKTETLRSNMITAGSQNKEALEQAISKLTLANNARHVPKRIRNRPHRILIPKVRVHDARMQEIQLLNHVRVYNTQ